MLISAAPVPSPAGALCVCWLPPEQGERHSRPPAEAPHALWMYQQYAQREVWIAVFLIISFALLLTHVSITTLVVCLCRYLLVERARARLNYPRPWGFAIQETTPELKKETEASQQQSSCWCPNVPAAASWQKIRDLLYEDLRLNNLLQRWFVCF